MAFWYGLSLLIWNYLQVLSRTTYTCIFPLRSHDKMTLHYITLVYCSYIPYLTINVPHYNPNSIENLFIMSCSCGRARNILKRQGIRREEVLGLSLNGDSVQYYN